jgi:hypothetical protein
MTAASPRESACLGISALLNRIGFSTVL